MGGGGGVKKLFIWDRFQFALTRRTGIRPISQYITYILNVTPRILNLVPTELNLNYVVLKCDPLCINLVLFI